MIKKEKKGKQLISSFIQPINNWLTEHPGDYLEIGCYYGVFLAEVAENFPNYKVYAIDPHIADGWTGEPQGMILSQIKEDFLYNIEGLDNIVFWEKTTEQCFKEKKFNDIKELSCVLIDGSHHYDDIIVDINFISNIKHKQDVFVFFDDLHIPDVVKAINYFIEKMDTQINQIDSNSFIIKANI
jgi:hypothetical protein